MSKSSSASDKEINDTINKANAKLQSFFATKDSNSDRAWQQMEQQRIKSATKTTPAPAPAPKAAAPAPAKSTGGSLDDLEKLAQLRDRGIITDAEFQAKKKQILGL